MADGREVAHDVTEPEIDERDRPGPHLKANALGVAALLFFVLSAQAPLTGIAGAGPIAIALGNGIGAPGAYLVAGAIVGLFAVGYLAVMPQWRYRVHRWEATPTAVYTQTGWITQERRIAPVSRIQTVDMARGPVAQALGLATVTVTTASAAGPLRIHGLTYADARHLVDDLTAATVTEAGDAT